MQLQGISGLDFCISLDGCDSCGIILSPEKIWIIVEKLGRVFSDCIFSR